jgi:hypothetical protein
MDQPTEPISPHDASGRLTRTAGSPDLRVAPAQGAMVGGRCHGRRTPTTQPAAADIPRSAAGPPPHAAPCRPTAPRRRSPAAPAPACEAPGFLGGNHRVEHGSARGSPITEQEPELPDAVRQLHAQVPGLLGHPHPGRVGGHPRRCGPAGSPPRSPPARPAAAATPVSTVTSPPPTWPWPEPAENCRQASADRLGARGNTGVLEDAPHGAGRSGIQGGTARRGCGDTPGRCSLASRSTSTRSLAATAGRPHW